MDFARKHSVQDRLIALYLERRAHLVRTFTARLRSPTAAEDLVQDIYVRLASLDDGVQVQNDVSYLYRLGSNLMLDRIRGEMRSTRRDSDWRDFHAVSVGGQDVVDHPDPESRLAARQRLSQVMKVVNTLPPRTAEAFRLHKLDGLSQPEVAARMGISKSAVEKHVAAALKVLLLRLP